MFDYNIIISDDNITGGVPFNNAFFGRGSGGIFLNNVRCNGNEDALINCSHSGIGVHTCRHRDDAGVRCLRKLDYKECPLYKGSHALSAILQI